MIGASDRTQTIADQISQFLDDRKAKAVPRRTRLSSKKLATERLADLIASCEQFERHFYRGRPITESRFESYKRDCREAARIAAGLEIDLAIEASGDPDRPVSRTPFSLDPEEGFEDHANIWVRSYVEARMI